MLRKKIKLVLSSILSIGIMGCTNDFLEEQPDNRLEINNLDAAAEALVFAYPDASYMFLEQMTDNVEFNDAQEYDPKDHEEYEWRENVSEINQDTPQYYWSAAYKAIAQANAVLVRIDELEGDEDYRKAIKGEALLCRAYAHFMLVNMFSEPYEASTASSKLGIPYVTEPETTLIQFYERDTMEEVYTFIEKDLKEGLNLVSDTYYSQGIKYHFTTKAAQAFASRFYLWTKNYFKAEEYANLVLGGSPENYLLDYDKIRSEGTAYDVFTTNMGDSSQQAHLMMGRTITFRLRFNEGYVGTFDKMVWEIFKYDVIGASVFADDKRGLFYSYTNNVGRFIPKHLRLFRFTNVTAQTGRDYTGEYLFRGEEVLLNRAEARMMQGNTAGAEADITILLNSRYNPALGIDVNHWYDYYNTIDLEGMDPLLRMILDQRRIEFVQEGLRWFDIRRHNLTVTHQFQDGTEDELTAKDLRKTLQIPESSTIYGLQKNERQDNSTPILNDNLKLN